MKNENNQDVMIDESKHQRVRPLTERVLHAVIAIFLSYTLYHIIGFWIFPGLGWYGLNPFGAFFGGQAVIKLIDVLSIAFFAVSGVCGWFLGKNFIDRLAHYVDFWKFW